MDYTLVHYRVHEWEQAAFLRAKNSLSLLGWPTASLVFDPTSVIQGLVFDVESGNLVKATRFGYVIRADHGTVAIPHEELRRLYAGTIVDLRDDRWIFVNTLFSLSEAILYSQLVDLLDAGEIPEVLSYRGLYERVRRSIDEVHSEGELKAAIVSNPDRFIELDPQLGITLLDQQLAGKSLLLITNSDWEYVSAVMNYALDPFVPNGLGWRSLFELVIVEARKPMFFLDKQAAFLMIDEESGLLRSHAGKLVSGRVHVGADAMSVEGTLGLSGAEMLYVGDHLFGDVHSSKASLRWRTALILRELESEIRSATDFASQSSELRALMSQKVEIEREVNLLRLARLRHRHGYSDGRLDYDRTIENRIRRLNARGLRLEARVGPLAEAANHLGNPRWGPLLRSGNDKSLYAGQLESFADVYTSRVSNLGLVTPYSYLRAGGGHLPHDSLLPDLGP